MRTPYEILGVGEDAGDQQIKEAYLRNVKECPPDRDPDHFERVRAAYEAVKDVKSRVSHALFTSPEAEFYSLLDRVFRDVRPQTLSAEQFESLLQAAATDPNLWKTIPTDLES